MTQSRTRHSSRGGEWTRDISPSFPSRRRHTRYIGDWSSDVCSSDLAAGGRGDGRPQRSQGIRHLPRALIASRSEERRVGKEWRSRWSPYHLKKTKLRPGQGTITFARLIFHMLCASVSRGR